MAFDERDVNTPKQVTEIQSVEEITFRRNRNLPGVQLEVIVTKVVRLNGEKNKVSGRVPQIKVDNNWPGFAKTLKQHLLDAIDNAAY